MIKTLLYNPIILLLMLTALLILLYCRSKIKKDL